MIDVVNVSKRFNALMGLDRVSCRVERGACLGVLGPDGAGKSSLLRCMSGRLKPEEGTVTIDGLRVERANLREINRRVGFLDLGENEVSDLTVMQNVLLGQPGSRRTLVRAEDRRLALEALEAVDLRPVASERVASLNDGDRQRLRMARLLAGSPSVLVVDGPFTRLGDPAARELIEVLKQLRQTRDLTLVCSFRDPEYALELTDSILGLRLGETEFLGPTSKLSPTALGRIFATEPSDCPWPVSRN